MQVMNRAARGAISVVLLSLSLIGADVTARAQTDTAATASPQQQLGREQLDQLVAPIALYPDNLLSEVLMASTYPLDIVNAERWYRNNKNLGTDQLKAAVDKQPWDQSVKALFATPDVLDMMSSKLDWTQKLGDAVIAQQTDVMDAVQRLRTRAGDNNKLTSTKEQTVKVEQAQNRQIIAIEPTQPDMVYVPYYDPGVVYGGWPYPDYPPYYWPAPGYIGAGLIAGGIAFGAGYALGRWAAGGGYWGGGFNWNNNNININRPINGAGTNWQRGSGNRQGLGGGGRQQGLGNRGVGNRGNLGNRASVGNRGNVGNRGGGNRAAGVGNRGHGGHAAHRGGGRQNLAARGGMHRGGGGMHAHRGGGGMHAMGGMRGGGGMHAMGGMRGGGGFRGGGGGRGRRSDIRVKHDVALLGYLDNGLGFYRFSYNGSTRVYVGVMAQDVQQVMPAAVMRGRDGYLRVDYTRLGLKFQSYNQWIASGAHLPASDTPRVFFPR
jgi:hypothetical protein